MKERVKRTFGDPGTRTKFDDHIFDEYGETQ